MSAILPVATQPHRPVAERPPAEQDAMYEGPKKFDDVMRQESNEQARGPEESSARESAAESEEGNGAEEQMSAENAEASHDGESQDQEQPENSADPETAEPGTIEVAGLPVASPIQKPHLNLGSAVVQPALENLPRAGLLALEKEVKPLTQALKAGVPSTPVPSGLMIDEAVAPAAASVATVEPAGEKLDLPVSAPVETAKGLGRSSDGAMKQAASKAVDVTAGKVGLPNFQSTVIHETIQPVDPTQSPDRMRMVEAILRAGGGELRQMAGKVLQLRLNPPELGRVQIRAQQRGGELIMQFEVERVEALRVFQDLLPSLEFSLAQASGESVTLELRQTDEFSLMEEGASEGHMEESRDESTPSDDGDEAEDDSPFEVLRDGSTVEVTA